MRKEYKRNLIKFSNYSLCVTLPKPMLNKLGLDKGDEMKITLKRGKLILEPAAGAKDGSWEPMAEADKE
jgi:antitoxin component of MazEF toxin-antitoxin module